MALIRPKLIALDSSTLGFLARDRLTNAAASHLVDLLNAGPLLPYLSGEHITELNQHADQNTRLARMDFLCSLRLVASFRSPEGQPFLGSYGHLQRAEILALLEKPSLRLHQVIEFVKPIACAGFCSGKEFVNANRSPLAYLAYTRAAANQVSHHADVVSLNQNALPTWVAWREIDRMTRGHGPALGSTILDVALAVFALYLESVQVDKRIFDSAGRAATAHPLLSTIQSKMFRTTGRNYQKLHADLQRIANAR